MKCYVIVASDGEYSSRRDWPYRVYTDKLHAELAMSVLDGVYKKLESAYVEHDRGRLDRETWRFMLQASLDEYVRLGFPDIYPDGCDFELVSWGLQEAELVS